MTQQTGEYERALERAHSAGLKVMGRGAWTNGATFHVVTSASEAGRFHLVTAHAGRLACDCTAGQHGRLCQHRALVREQLETELQRQVEQRAAVVAAEREVAPLARDNRAFSIWKS